MAVDTDDSAGTTTVTHARATVRPDKAAAVAELAEAFRSSAAAVLTEYRGLTVKQLSDLRTALGADTSYAVVKNTLTKIAAADAGIPGVEALLEGPTAVAFIAGEPVDAAKALRDFAKANPALVVKGGVMEGRALTADEVRRLADLESREVLLGKMAGALLASLSNAVYLFNAPLAQAARLAGALQQKATEDPSIIGGAGTPAADPVEAAVDAEGAAPAADATPGETAPAADDAGAPEATAEEGVTPAETDSETDSTETPA